MNNNKLCNFCNRLTADEIIKGDIFCIECGHQRGTSPQQEQTDKAREKKAERKKGWHKWYKWILLIIVLSLANATKLFIEDNIKAKRAVEQKKLSKYKIIKNMLNLPNENIQQLSDLTEKARSLITNNLIGQDKVDFLTFSSAGSRLTTDESYKLTALIEKSKNSMSAEDRAAVERFQQEVRKLMK